MIDFDRKTADQKHLHNPVNNRIVSRVPKEIAVAASLAASPVAAANLQQKAPERAPVVHNHGDIKNEYKFEMHIHGADSKQIPEIKDEMEKLIKKHMAEAERKRRLEDKRQLMDRSKGGGVLSFNDSATDGATGQGYLAKLGDFEFELKTSEFQTFGHHKVNRMALESLWRLLGKSSPTAFCGQGED